MRMDFNWEKVDGLAKALGGRIALIESLIHANGLTPKMIELIRDSEFRKDFIHLYGFHIDSNESDPTEAVTYLEDAVGMTPAHMNYSTGEFDYGSWKDAFFMPRPCMLKYDGTVDYYLDPNDYLKKEDGTPSDAAYFNYNGNAMMEWGRDGKQIWCKVVPDEDDKASVSIYFSDQKLDDGFHAWSFINNQGRLVDHFYTPIYNGTIDMDNRLRSISDKAILYLCKSKTAQWEIEAAERNNPGEDKLWYTETYADTTLINYLLILIGKCLNTQLTFGNGRTEYGANASAMIPTGTMDDKGLFFGTADTIHGVKVFGMENYWANQNRRIAGLVSVDGNVRYKMTRNTYDGSSASDYNTDGTGYLNSTLTARSSFGGFVSKYYYKDDGSSFLYSISRGSNHTYYADHTNISIGNCYATRGGYTLSNGTPGAFSVSLMQPTTWNPFIVGAALSCKPLS